MGAPTTGADPWIVDSDFALLQGDAAMRVLRRLGALTEAEERKVTRRLLVAHKAHPGTVSP